MTDVRARHDFGPAFDEKPPTLDRRQLIRAGAWAAPVIVLATAAPAAAAQSVNTGNVPASALAVTAYGLYDSNSEGTHGPLYWSGGQVGYWNPVNGVAIASFTWTALLLKPDGTSATVGSGAATTPAGQSFTIPSMSVAAKPLLLGKYTLTLTVFGSGSTSVSDQEFVSIA